MIICCWLMLTKSQAQNFAPIGAKWHYSIGNIDFNGVKCAVLTVQGDTLIYDITASVIEVKLVDNPGVDKIVSYEYLTKQNDSLMYYNPYDKKFHLLYNFSAKAGDTIHVHKNLSRVTPGFLVPKLANDSITFSYRILSTDSVMINGNWKKRQTISDVMDSYYSMETYKTDSFRVIIDGLYSFTYLFGRAALITMETTECMLRCYNDSTYNFKYAKWDKPCDYANSYTGLSEKNIYNQIAVYPNPIQKGKTVTLSNNKHKNISCQIISNMGETINFFEIKDNKFKIENVPSGIYYLVFYSNNTIIEKTKLLIYE